MPNSPSHAKQAVPEPSPELLSLIQRAMAAQQQKYQRPMGLAPALEQVAGELLAERDTLRAENAELKRSVVELRKAINCEVDLANKPMLSEAYYITTARLVTNDKALDGREGGKA